MLRLEKREVEIDTWSDQLTQKRRKKQEKERLNV